MTQSELAAEMGCSAQTISNIETGRHGVSHVLARKLSLRFGLMPSDPNRPELVDDRISAVEQELREIRTQLAELRRLLP